MKVRDSRIFYINSGNQLSATENSFTYEVQFPKEVKYDRISLLKASIPISYYLVQDTQNTFTLIEGKSSVVITVPKGNYSRISFAVELTSLLNTYSPNGYTYKILYSNGYNQVDDGLYSFYSSWVVSSSTEIGFTFGNNNINELFGFNRGSTVYFSNNTINSILLSTNVPKFIPEDSIFVHCDICIAKGNKLFSDVIDVIFAGNSISYGIVNWSNPDPYLYSRELNLGETNFIRFSITDENNLPLFLNGNNVIFEIICFVTEDTVNNKEELSNIREELKSQKGIIENNSKIIENIGSGINNSNEILNTISNTITQYVNIESEKAEKIKNENEDNLLNELQDSLGQ